jgi:PPP family 3-phenylpropionic acid transporter
MVLFERVRKKISTGALLKIAGIGYIVKHVILLMAKSYAGVLFAMMFQLVSFAVYIPAIVAYMHEHTSAEDAVKGQSLMPLASSAAGLLSSFSGGFMIDRLGVGAFLIACVVMAVLGTLIVFAAVDSFSTKPESRFPLSVIKPRWIRVTICLLLSYNVTNCPFTSALN